jgi:hypothetical protein
MVSLYEQMAMVGHYLATMKLPLIVLARLRKYALEFHLYRSFNHLMSVLRNGTKRYAIDNWQYSDILVAKRGKASSKTR